MSRIRTAEDLRAVLGESIVALLEGRVSVAQANSVATPSVEIHKSIRQEWDMRCYMAENLTIEQSAVVRKVISND